MLADINVALLKEQRDEALVHATHCLKHNDEIAAHYWLKIHKQIEQDLAVVYKALHDKYAERAKNKNLYYEMD